MSKERPRDGAGRRQTPGGIDEYVYPNTKAIDVTAKDDGSKSSLGKQKGKNTGEESSNPQFYKTDMKVGTPKRTWE